MLYLDYAKKVVDGYILNFFADSEEDIAEVADGKEFITKNGTNYGAPLASSTVVVTMPDKSIKTYVLNEEGIWTIGGEKSGTEVEANVDTTDQDEDLKSLKVGDTVYKNSKMIPKSNTTASTVNWKVTKMEYDGQVYSTGVLVNQGNYEDVYEQKTLEYIVDDTICYKVPNSGITDINKSGWTNNVLNNMEIDGELYKINYPIINSSIGTGMTKERLRAIEYNDKYFTTDFLAPYNGTAASNGKIEKVEYNNMVYNIGGLTPYTGTSVPGTDLKQVEYDGTVYNVGGGSSGGVPTVEIVVKLSDDEQSFISVETMSNNDFYTFIHSYMAGEINIRFRMLSEQSGSYDNDWYFDAICLYNHRGCNSHMGIYYDFYCLASLDMYSEPTICKVNILTA